MPPGSSVSSIKQAEKSLLTPSLVPTHMTPTAPPYKIPHINKTNTKKNLIKTLKKDRVSQWLCGFKHVVFSHDEIGLRPLNQEVNLQTQIL